MQDGLVLKQTYLAGIKSKFYCIIVLDGKKRSLYCSILTKARYKISIVTKIFYKFIFKFNFTKIIYDDYSQNKIDLHKNALKILNFNIIEDDLNVLLNRKFNSTLNNSGISPLFENKAFIMLHFDEKWIFNDYIKSYKKIEPKINEFKKFVLNIVNTSKKNLIITNGISPNNITNNFRDELTKINTNC